MPLTLEDHAYHRELGREIIASGHLQQILGMLEGFDPGLDFTQIGNITHALIDEAESFGLTIPFPHVQDLVIMQALMVPAPDYGLALAISRIYVFIAHYDDLCSRDRAASWQVLAGLLDTDHSISPVSPLAAYLDHAFRQLAPHCPASVLGILRGLCTRANLGILMETQYALDADDRADTDFVRELSGFCEFWWVTLQFTHPSLAMLDNLDYYAATFAIMNQYIIDINDMCSFYKEIRDGDDFAATRIYRRSQQTGRPYLEEYQQVLDSAISTGNRACQLASREQEPHVRHYEQGYIYWHTHTRRYGWHEIFPGLIILGRPPK
jgi:hypothetical protein